MVHILLQIPTSVSLPADSLFFGDVLFSVFKFLFIACAVLYVFFAGIVVRQIQLMRSTLSSPFSPYMQILGLIHLGLAIAVVWFFFVIL